MAEGFAAVIRLIDCCVVVITGFAVRPANRATLEEIGFDLLDSHLDFLFGLRFDVLVSDFDVARSLSLLSALNLFLGEGSFPISKFDYADASA